MGRMILRFMGKIYAGMEMTCFCGYDFGKITCCGQMDFCPKCRTKYEIEQHSSHWHLFISPKMG